MNKKEKKVKISLMKKILMVIIPCIVLSYVVVFVVTLSNTRDVLHEYAMDEMELLSSSVKNEISAETNRVIGIMENVRTSLIRSCNNNQEIQDYIYSVADAYTDIIPAGIYCGLSDGTYIDKLWTPDADWVMKERPWYVDGIDKDEVTFGEMYLDANTEQYIISAYANIQDASGNVIGVVCADVQLDAVESIITDATLFEQGYMYAIDKTTGMILGNKIKTENNGKVIYDLTDEHSQKVSSMIQNEGYDSAELCNGQYIYMSEVPNTNFILVCCASKADVEANLMNGLDSSVVTLVIGIIDLCVILAILIRYMLKPVKGITGVIHSLHELDLTKRAPSKTKDELGDMAEDINMFADNLQNVMGKMKDAVKEVDEKADVNATTAVSLSNMAEEQNESMNRLINIMSEVSDSINMIAIGATKLTGVVSDTNEITVDVEGKLSNTVTYINDGKNEIEKMTVSMESISELSSDLQNAVCDVEEGLKGINAMVGMINDIAEQTNLLSLNASIEAARAGEAGRGFAVVADEIRVLADNSANTANRIVETIDKMGGLVQIVISKTTESITKIDNGNEAVKSTNAAFYKIQEIINEINESMKIVRASVVSMDEVATDMAASTQEQNASTESVLASCEQVMTIAQKFNEEGIEMAEAGKKLKELSYGLAEQVEQFKI